MTEPFKFVVSNDPAKARNAIGPLHAAVGDGTTNDTDAFTDVWSDAVAAVMTQAGYRIDNVSVTNAEIRGEHFNRLLAANTNPILRLRSGSALRNATIDGEGQASSRVRIGGSGDAHVDISDVVIVDCPGTSFRADYDISGVRMVNIYADGSKVFNTEDSSTVSNLVFSGLIVVNGPNEAFLLDFPGSTSEWTGFSIANSVWELSADSKRAIGIARAVGGVITGQAIRGHLSDDNPTDSDLIHFEDKAQTIAVVGNVLETNGTYRAIDGATGGDVTYTQTDRNPKELLISGNLCKATDSDTDALVYLNGTLPDGFEDSAITGNALLCNGVADPLQMVAKDGAVVGGNLIFDAPSAERVRTGDTSGYASADGANVIRPQSHYVNPTFLRSDPGHGFSPGNVLFRTTFGFDSYANFQAWAQLIKTVTGATIASFTGSLGGGSITFPVDAGTGGIYLRATRGASAMTARMTLAWNVHDIGFQPLDAFCARILTRSSVQNAGKVVLQTPSAGPSDVTKVLNDGADYATWKADGASRTTPNTANFYAGGAGTIQALLYFGDGLASSGNTCDIGIFAMSMTPATPF